LWLILSDANRSNLQANQGGDECGSESDTVIKAAKSVKERIALLEQKGGDIQNQNSSTLNKINRITLSEMSNKSKGNPKLDFQTINSKKEDVLEDFKSANFVMLSNEPAYKALSQSSDVINDDVTKISNKLDRNDYSKTVSSNLFESNISINGLSNLECNYDCHLQPSYRRFTSYDSIVGLSSKSNKSQQHSANFLINSMIDKKFLNANANYKLKGLVIREPSETIVNINKPLPTIVSSSLADFHALDSQSSQDNFSSLLKDQRQQQQQQQQKSLKENLFTSLHSSSGLTKPIKSDPPSLVQDSWSSAKNIIPKYSPAFKRRSLEISKLSPRFNDSGISSIASSPGQSPANHSTVEHKSDPFMLKEVNLEKTSNFLKASLNRDFSHSEKCLDRDESVYKKNNQILKLNQSSDTFANSNLNEVNYSSINEYLNGNVSASSKNEAKCGPSFKQLTKAWEKLTSEDGKEERKCVESPNDNLEIDGKMKHIVNLKSCDDDLNIESKNLDQTQLLSFDYIQGTDNDNQLVQSDKQLKDESNRFEEEFNNTEDGLIKSSQEDSDRIMITKNTCFVAKSLDLKCSQVSQEKHLESPSDVESSTSCEDKKETENKLDLDNYLEIKGRKSSKLDELNEAESNDLSNDSGNSSPEGCNSIGYSSSNVVSRASSVSNLRDSQYGSVSSLASSTSLISPQELQTLIDEANQSLEGEIAGQNNNIQVVVLHREYNTSGSIGITLAGGIDYETKEITVSLSLPLLGHL